MGRRWRDVIRYFATWQDLLARFQTWAQLLAWGDVVTRTVFQTYGAVNPAVFEGYIRGYVSFTPTQALVNEGMTLPKITAAIEVAPTEESGADYLSEFEVELATTDQFGGGWAYLVREELWYHDTSDEPKYRILDRQYVIEVPPGSAVTLEALREGEEESS